MVDSPDGWTPIEEGKEIRASGTPTINDVETLLDDQKLSGKQAVWRLLGHAIPAQSDAAAVNVLRKLESSGRNFHMPVESAKNLQDGQMSGRMTKTLIDVKIGCTAILEM
jgi:hypothetical protein